MLEIRDLADDQIITEPGFYRCTLTRHHNQPCDGPSVTSGVLRRMELYSAADVWAFSKLNPDRFDQEETDALRLGAAMAYMIEGGLDALLQHFALHADDKPRKPTAAQIKAIAEGRGTEAGIASAAYWDAVNADPHRYLDRSELDLIAAMAKALVADPGAMAVMGGIPEVTMAWRDEITGLWLLARPDTVNADGTVTDYKKMAPSGKPFTHRMVDQRITDGGFDMQLAFGAEVFERLTGDWPQDAAIVAQSDTPPYHVIIRPLLDEDMRIGQFRNRRSINRFAECLASGDWPGPGADVGAYQRPDWQRQMLIEQMQVAGEAP